MRKILLILLLLFISASSFGQKIRFTDTVNSWKIQESSGWPDKVTHVYYPIRFNGFVTKNGVTYSNILNLGLCREDTIQNKVYMLNTSDTVEKVLYDYNLQVGDTFAYYFFGLGSKNAKGIVISIDSVLIAGTYHKIWNFHNFITNLYPGSIIEGVGIMAWGTPELGSNVVCFRRNGIMIPIDYYITSSTCALAVNNINADNKTVAISPNPANPYSKISFPYTIQSGSLTITDILGKTVSTKTINNKTETIVGELPAIGIYFYRLTDFTNNQSYTGKFIYE